MCYSHNLIYVYIIPEKAAIVNLLFTVGSYQLPEEIVDMFDDYNMAAADDIAGAPEAGSGDVLAIGLSDPEGAMDYVYNAIEDRCRRIESTSQSRGNFGVTVIKVA